MVNGSMPVFSKSSWQLTAALLLAVLEPVLETRGVAGVAVGIFEGESEVGAPRRAGSVVYDAAAGTYAVSGGGENMWFTNDAFHFVWKRVSGDFDLRAGIEWVGSGGNAHRKACLLVRQSLEPNSPYVDIAVHGDGLTSLQFRTEQGGLTREIRVPVSGPRKAGIQRRGNTFVALLPGGAGGELEPAGAFMRVGLADPVYVGLGVCAHDDKALERVVFSGVHFGAKEPGNAGTPQLHCALEVAPIASKDRQVIYHTTNHIEAPNWSRDGEFLLFNSGGRIYRLPAQGGSPRVVDTGFANRCNNDHGISPDGTWLVISDQSQTGKSMIYTLPMGGGTPQLVTPLGPSYWHGWSPDGRTLVYCAERNGEYDVYSIPATGGDETRLTDAKGLDDGPEYSADGKFIYFNSDRTGTMQIWRMKPDGSDQEQVTSDAYNNWFAHPSPDGKWLVFLSYETEVKGHPANQVVRLRLMPQSGGPIQELAALFGGQGTINVPSWSPDSRQVAFVSYELLR
jgi:TolB protein